MSVCVRAVRAVEEQAERARRRARRAGGERRAGDERRGSAGGEASCRRREVLRPSDDGRRVLSKVLSFEPGWCSATESTSGLPVRARALVLHEQRTADARGVRPEVAGRVERARRDRPAIAADERRARRVPSAAGGPARAARRARARRRRPRCAPRPRRAPGSRGRRASAQLLHRLERVPPDDGHARRARGPATR